MDKTSGKDMDRPEFQACLRTLQAGDMLHVHSIDRLTRSLQDLLVILEEMADRNITVKFYKENLIFSGESSPFQSVFGNFSFYSYKKACGQKKTVRGSKNSRRLSNGTPAI